MAMIIGDNINDNYPDLSVVLHTSLIVKRCSTAAPAFMTPNTRGLTEAPIVTLHLIARSSIRDVIAFCDVTSDFSNTCPTRLTKCD